MAVALWLFGDVRDGFECIERTETPVGVYDAPATLSGAMPTHQSTECGMFRWH
jgi:hypothetical protein